MYNRAKLHFISLGLVWMFLLPACTSVPLTSLPKLRGLKPETVDMKQLEMAVRLPAGIGIVKDSAALDVSLKNGEGGELTKKMILQDPIPQLTDYLTRKQGRDHRIYRFKLTGEQLAEAESFRKEALEFSETFEGQTSSHFSAAAGFCSYDPEALYKGVTMTFYIRTKSDKEFFKLFKERAVTFKDKAGLAKARTLPPCAKSE